MARCLDGTPGAYYVSAGTNGVSAGQRKFYIYKSKGGNCGTLGECRARADTLQGSSSEAYGWRAYMDLHDKSLGGNFAFGFSRVQLANPLMWDWNHIMIVYCDGAYFAGSKPAATFANGTQIYMNGKDILDAVLKDIDEKYDLRHAEDVVIGGCAAGAMSNYITLDWMRSHAALRSVSRVAGFQCSGFYLATDSWWLEDKKATFHLHGLSTDMQPQCSRDNVMQEFLCAVPAVAAAYLRTPMFLWESQYNEYMLRSQPDTACWKTFCAKVHKERFANALMQLSGRSPHIGIYLHSCPHHCDTSSLGDVSLIHPINGDFPMTALARWYYTYFAGVGNEAARFWYYDKTFPSKSSCPRPSKHTHDAPML